MDKPTEQQKLESRKLHPEVGDNVVIVRHCNELIADALKPVYEQVLDIVF